jgi:hypothetical protein
VHSNRCLVAVAGALLGVRRENFSLEEVVPMSKQVQLLCLQATEELADSNLNTCHRLN